MVSSAAIQTGAKSLKLKDKLLHTAVIGREKGKLVGTEKAINAENAEYKPFRDIRKPDAKASRLARLSPLKWDILMSNRGGTAGIHKNLVPLQERFVFLQGDIIFYKVRKTKWQYQLTLQEEHKMFFLLKAENGSIQRKLQEKQRSFSGFVK